MTGGEGSPYLRHYDALRMKIDMRLTIKRQFVAFGHKFSPIDFMLYPGHQ